jgi:Tol biopolymer transport system component
MFIKVKISFVVLLAFCLFIGCRKEEKKVEAPADTEVNLTVYDMAFQKDDKVCILKYDDMKIDSTLTGSDPCISPDGKKIAYTDFSNDKRHVTIYNPTTKQQTPVNIPNDNNYGPAWSPDNNLLAFSVFKNHNWYIGVVNKENSIFKFVTDKLTRGAYSPSWSPDSKRLIVQDLDKIYLLDLDGNILKTFEVKEVAKNYSVSSSTKFIYTPDEKSFIYSAGVDEDGDFDEPPEAVFIYDIQNKKIKRLTPKGLYCTDPVLNTKNEVLFSGSKSMDEPCSIYKVSLNGGKPELVIKDASLPSVRSK